MGRPLKPINPDEVERLASIGCTLEEMALVLGCSISTLERRFDEVIKRGRAHLKSSIRRMQLEAARNGNVTMLIWLGKQLLGQRDEAAIEHAGELNLHYDPEVVKAAALAYAQSVDLDGEPGEG